MTNPWSFDQEWFSSAEDQPFHLLLKYLLLLLVVAIAMSVVIGVLRYILYRDLRRTLITASLAFAFVPQLGMSALVIVLEYWLRGGQATSPVASITTAVLSTIVVVTALICVDRQDARRIRAVVTDGWDRLANTVMAFCGSSIEPRSFLAHLVRHFPVPATFKSHETVVRDTLWDIVDQQLSAEEAITRLTSGPQPLSPHHAKYILMRVKGYMRDI